MPGRDQLSSGLVHHWHFSLFSANNRLLLTKRGMDNMRCRFLRHPLPYSDQYRAVVTGTGLDMLSDPDQSHHRWQYLTGRCTAADLAREILSYNEHLEAPEAVVNNIAKLAAGAAVVIAGQQPYPIGGPLFLLYKAVMVVRTAAILSEQTGRSVVPVFWVHSDDHDYNEMKTVHIWGRDDRIVPVTWPAMTTGGRVGDYPVTDHVTGFMAVVAAACGGDDTVELLTPGPADDIGKWQARVLLRLLGSEGLIVFDPRVQTARDRAAPVLMRCAAASDWSQLIDMPLEPGHSCLFYHGPAGREALIYTSDRAATRSGSLTVTRTELQTMIEHNSELFSPNVALRPYVQDALFPVLAAVSGPGEAAYLPALAPMGERLQQELPPVLPRLSLTIVDPGACHLLSSHDLSVSELGNWPGSRDRVLRTLGLADVESMLHRLNAVISDQYRVLSSELAEIDHDLVAITDKNRQHVKAQVDYLLNKVRQKFRKRHKPLITELRSAADRLWPDSRPQEGIISTASYTARWPDLISALMSAPLNGQHRLLVLEDDEA